MKLTRLFNDFFNSGKAGGLILVFVTIGFVVLKLTLSTQPREM